MGKKLGLIKYIEAGGARFSIIRERTTDKKTKLIIRVVSGPKQFIDRFPKKTVFTRSTLDNDKGFRELIQRTRLKASRTVIVPRKDLLQKIGVTKKQLVSRKSRTFVDEIVTSEKKKRAGRVGAVFEVSISGFRSKKSFKKRVVGYSGRTSKPISELSKGEIAQLLIVASRSAVQNVLKQFNVGSDRVNDVEQITLPFYLYYINKTTARTQPKSIERGMPEATKIAIEQERLKKKRNLEFAKRFK